MKRNDSILALLNSLARVARVGAVLFRWRRQNHAVIAISDVVVVVLLLLDNPPRVVLDQFLLPFKKFFVQWRSIRIVSKAKLAISLQEHYKVAH